MTPPEQRPGRLLRVLAAAGGGVLLAACGGQQSAVEPRSPEAAELAWLWWFILIAGSAVYVIVMAIAVVPWWRSRRVPPADDPEVRVDPASPMPEGPADRWLVLVGGIAAPAVILVVLLVVSAPIGVRTAPERAANPDPLVIEIVGHMFWWEVIYPEEGIVTANEVHVPVGREVELRMTSEDVIHSWWVPQLHGKIDLTPGHQTRMVFQADEAGVYRGQCAEYCGLSHAHMAMLVVAEENDDFTAWVERQQQPAAEIAEERIRAGQQIFTGSGCTYCHTVRGHSAPAPIGPDLTHLASRRTLGAGRLPNTRGHLAGWILDPQTLKPGNEMPGTEMDGASLDLLLDYLETLE